MGTTTLAATAATGAAIGAGVGGVAGVTGIADSVLGVPKMPKLPTYGSPNFDLSPAGDGLDALNEPLIEPPTMADAAKTVDDAEDLRRRRSLTQGKPSSNSLLLTDEETWGSSPTIKKKSLLGA